MNLGNMHLLQVEYLKQKQNCQLTKGTHGNHVIACANSFESGGGGGGNLFNLAKL